MPTVKLMGCGGTYSIAQFSPCFACMSKNDEHACGEILKHIRSTKHEEYCSDLRGKSVAQRMRKCVQECNIQ